MPQTPKASKSDLIPKNEEESKVVESTKNIKSIPKKASKNNSAAGSSLGNQKPEKPEAAELAENSLNLNGCILIAMPDLESSVFSQSVVFVCDHAEHGSLGVVLNKAINLSLGDLFDKLELPYKKKAKYLDQPILLGGPVESDKGFVIHPNQETKFISNVERDLTITTSMDILEHLAKKTGPQKFIIALGCAMWEAGQLLDEIRRNRWLVWSLGETPEQKLAELEHFVFDIDVAKKYNTALKGLGLEPWQLTMFGGNA